MHSPLHQRIKLERNPHPQSSRPGEMRKTLRQSTGRLLIWRENHLQLAVTISQMSELQNLQTFATWWKRNSTGNGQKHRHSAKFVRRKIRDSKGWKTAEREGAKGMANKHTTALASHSLKESERDGESENCRALWFIFYPSDNFTCRFSRMLFLNLCICIGVQIARKKRGKEYVKILWQTCRAGK